MLHPGHLLLVLLLTYQLVVHAADNGLHEEEPTSCVDGCSKRTMFNIVWACISTTIICAWAAIHPNIPPREGPFKRIIRRLELMFWAIVAPEILPAWALNQWLAAMAVSDLYNKKIDGQVKCGIRKDHMKAFWKTLTGWFSIYEIKEPASFAWTTRHGHFLIMGGFHLVEPVEGDSTSAGTQQDVASVQLSSTPTDTETGSAPGNKTELKEGRVTILTLEMLQVLLEDPEFRIRITDEEIADKSKGDALAKAILILQSSWFICQCMARYVQGLSLTQLELTTVALASLNGITFILWWNKPLGVETPVRVYMGRRLTDAERATEGRGRSDRSRLLPWSKRMIKEWWIGAGWLLGVLRQDQGSKRSGRVIVLRFLVILPFLIVMTPFFFVSRFAFGFFYTISDVVWISGTSFPAEATHVPTFYAPRHQHSKYLHSLLLLVFGTIFGAIHCAGWNLPFPTHSEQKLWRIASAAVTIFPIAPITSAVVIIVIPFIIILIAKLIVIVLFFLIFRLLSLIFRLLGRSHLIDLIDLMESNLKPIIPIFPTILNRLLSLPIRGVIAIRIFSTYYMLPYGAARLLLLGLAVALLRHQPPSAFVAVDWTRFYPHFF